MRNAEKQEDGPARTIRNPIRPRVLARVRLNHLSIVY